MDSSDKKTFLGFDREDLPIVLFAILSGLLILLAILSSFTYKNYFKVDELKHSIVKEDPFKNVKLTAQSAAVWDMKNQKFIFTEQSNKVMPLASIAKLMTAMAALELVPNYTVIPITREYLEEEGDTGLLVNERWRLEDLVILTLVSSSNDGSRAIASIAGAAAAKQSQTAMSGRDLFVQYLNKRAKELGLNSTTFKNENGLDVNGSEGGAYGTARDVALLVDYMVRNHKKILEPTKSNSLQISSLDSVRHRLKNTNSIVDRIPGIIASKTGFTDLAQGNLAVAFSPGMGGPYVVVVLGSTYSERFQDVERLVQATLSQINK